MTLPWGPASFRAPELDARQMLRVKSIEGEQGSDIVFYHGYNYDER